MTAARIRRQFEPHPSDPNAVEEVCIDCGEKFYRRKGRRRFRCAECAAARAVANNEQQSLRQGPEYERTVKRQVRLWLGEMQRLGMYAGCKYEIEMLIGVIPPD